MVGRLAAARSGSLCSRSASGGTRSDGVDGRMAERLRRRRRERWAQFAQRVPCDANPFLLIPGWPEAHRSSKICNEAILCRSARPIHRCGRNDGTRRSLGAHGYRASPRASRWNWVLACWRSRSRSARRSDGSPFPAPAAWNCSRLGSYWDLPARHRLYMAGARPARVGSADRASDRQHLAPVVDQFSDSRSLPCGCVRRDRWPCSIWIRRRRSRASNPWSRSDRLAGMDNPRSKNPSG